MPLTCIGDLWSSQQSKPQQFHINAHLTSDQLKVCTDILPCTQSRTSGSSLVFPTLMLVWAILLQAVSLTNCSSFQIQLNILHYHP